MAVSVVEALEMIDVAEQQAQLAARRHRLFGFLQQRIVEIFPVRDPGQPVGHRLLLDGLEMLAERLDLARRFLEPVAQLRVLRGHALGIGDQGFDGAAQRIEVLGAGHRAQVRFQGFAIFRYAVVGFAQEAKDRIDRFLDLMARLLDFCADAGRAEIVRRDGLVLVLGKGLVVRQDEVDRLHQIGIASAGVGVPDLEIPRCRRNLMLPHQSQRRIGILLCLGRAVDMFHIRDRVSSTSQRNGRKGSQTGIYLQPDYGAIRGNIVKPRLISTLSRLFDRPVQEKAAMHAARAALLYVPRCPRASARPGGSPG